MLLTKEGSSCHEISRGATRLLRGFVIRRVSQLGVSPECRDVYITTPLHGEDTDGYRKLTLRKSVGATTAAPLSGSPVRQSAHLVIKPTS